MMKTRSVLWMTLGFSLPCTAPAWAATALPGADDPSATRTTYLQTDAVGSVRAETGESSGTIITEHRYEPFGLALPAEPLSTETPRFAGKLRDPISGLDDFGARHFAAETGRFLATDPLTCAAKRFANPQDLNLYSYALNNPLKYGDPTGAAAEPGFFQWLNQPSVDTGTRTVTNRDWLELLREGAETLYVQLKTMIGAVSFAVPEVGSSATAIEAPFLYGLGFHAQAKDMAWQQASGMVLGRVMGAGMGAMGSRMGSTGTRLGIISQGGGGEEARGLLAELRRRITAGMEHADEVEQQLGNEVTLHAQRLRDYMRLRVEYGRNPTTALRELMAVHEFHLNKHLSNISKLEAELGKTQNNVRDLMGALNELTPPSDAGPLLNWDDPGPGDPTKR